MKAAIWRTTANNHTLEGDSQGWTFVYAEGVIIIPTLTLSKPSLKQAEFLKADKKYIAFGGARGG